MKLTLKEFKNFLIDIGVNEEYAKDIYISECDGCIPNSYISDDLLRDIIEKFKHPLQFVIRVIEEKLRKGLFLFAMVEPSYEDSTHSIVLLVDLHDLTDAPKVVYNEWMKAWNYGGFTKAEFEKHLKDIHDTILKNIKR